ncbi:MAG TPA: PD-(D/E)XK nuclease family protein, partial [Thermoanaerobaculia bacterium]|nr:PD-(D/E)XK nuclease family protein [Thermoanaerobaculia bacterium]
RSGTRSIFDGYVPAVYDFIEPRLTALSPTQLEDFGECPQKFLLKHILGVEDLEQPEREIQVHHRDKGTLDHRVLERFYRSLTDDDRAAAIASLPRLPESLGEKLEILIDDAFDQHERDVPPFNTTVRGIERRATKRILREFVLADLADLEANGLTPAYFEYQFGSVSKRRPNPSAPSFTVAAGNVTLRVEGTIDRIDEGERRFRIVDYKSGKALRHDKLAEKIDRGVRLQLALYAMAVADIFKLDPANVSGTIKPLVTSDGKSRFGFSLQEKQERLLETLALFMNAIRGGLFPDFPSRDDDFDSCKYCPVNHSCRTRHDLDERYAIQQQKDPRTLLAGGA